MVEIILTEFHIGIDDTDSKIGGCTTYTATVLFQELLRRGFTPADFPWLVRLNPNIPWKTRGNGALSIHLLVEERNIETVKKLALGTLEKTCDPSIPSTDPAVTFLEGRVPAELAAFSAKALHDVIQVEEARHVLERIGGEAHVLKGPRGLIGALAAIGAELTKDHTFEIIAYRTIENLGTPRRLDPESVMTMDANYRGRTFNNIDPETGRILISPHGPDPVLFGIRGEDPFTLVEALSAVRVHERVERVMVFKTNHGTDAHLAFQKCISDLRWHQSAAVAGRITTPPTVLKGGHVIFGMSDGTGCVDCAAYTQTGSFRNVALQLLPGDRVIACGGVRKGPAGHLTLNLERLEIVQLMEHFRWEKPRCSDCGYGCESMGRGQGFRCKKCSRRYPRNSARLMAKERGLKTSVYVPPPRANRHLTKPLSRYTSDPLNKGMAGEDPVRENYTPKFCDAESFFHLENLLKTVQPASPL